MEDVNSLALYSEHLLHRAWLASANGYPGSAVMFLDEAIGTLALGAQANPEHRKIENLLTLAAYRYWDLHQELPKADVLSLLPDYRAYNDRIQACLDASMAVRKAVMLGEPAAAADLVNHLLDRGYREAGFMQVCNEFYSCTGR